MAVDEVVMIVLPMLLITEASTRPAFDRSYPTKHRRVAILDRLVGSAPSTPNATI